MYSRGMRPPPTLFSNSYVVSAVTSRLDRELDLRELARTTGLLLVRVVVTLDGLLDRLAVRDLGLADVRLDAEFALHAVDQDVECSSPMPLMTV